MESGLIAGGSSLVIMMGYCPIKKMRRSDCALEKCSGCLTIHVPADIELVKQNTSRLEKMVADLILQVNNPQTTTIASSTSPNLPANASSLNSNGTQNIIASGL